MTEKLNKNEIPLEKLIMIMIIFVSLNSFLSKKKKQNRKMQLTYLHA